LALEPSKPFPFVVSRLLEDELPVLSPWLRPIRRDYLHEMLVYTPEERYLLPCVFLAAEDLFGRSSQSFDFYKCSFKFPLFLSATKEGRPIHRVVRSERLVYGNRAGDLFEKVLGDHDEDAFHRAINAIESDLAEEEARHERADLEHLLGCIERGEIRM
jgi:hypothetical protein